VGIGLVLTNGDGDESGSTSSSTTTSTTATSSTTTAPPPPSTTSPDDPPPPGSTPANAAGALLAAPPPPVTQSTAPPDASCEALGDAGWTVKACGTAALDGGPRVWLVEHRAVPGIATEAWRALVLQWSQGRGAWLVDLQYKDDDAGLIFDINVLPSDLTGDGRPELVFGFHFTGSGSLLGYDVVTGTPAGAPAVAVHRELSHGAAQVSEGGITDYDARYPNNEPNCCPAYVQQSTVSEHGGAWFVTEVARVDAAGAGNL
jgi:hypothetical protein